MKVKYLIKTEGVNYEGQRDINMQDFNKVIKLLEGGSKESPTIAPNQIDLEDMIKDVENGRSSICDNLKQYPVRPEDCEDYIFPGTDNI